MIWLLFWSVAIVVIPFLSISITFDENIYKKKRLNMTYHDHNRYRKRHCVPPLEWSDDLAEAAGNWASALLDTRDLKYQPNTEFGQNLWYSTYELDYLYPRANGTIDVAVVAWYEEKRYYPDGPYEGYRPFTQLIWKDSKYVGCGIRMARATGRDDYLVRMVCNYKPPGNVQNKFDENVLPESKGPCVFKNAESTPYWIYGLGFLILSIVIFLAIYIYYKQKPTEFTESETEAEAEEEAE